MKKENTFSEAIIRLEMDLGYKNSSGSIIELPIET